MNTFTPDNFFDLTKFKHRSIFAAESLVWTALSKIESYINEHTLGIIECDIPDGAYIINPELIFIGPNTIIEPGAYIKGPCIIGENCTIRHGAYIRGNLITGNHCVLGHDSEFKNSILLDNAHAAHFAYVGDTILGNRVNLGAGTVCANLRFDNQSIKVLIDGKKIDTGLKKFGAILGDNSQTGCNSVLNPGTLFGKEVSCYPCTNVGGVHLLKQLIRKV